MAELPYSAAADRNTRPIFGALHHVRGERGAALKIASGTGQHAVWLAAAMPHWTWQPTDADARLLPAIARRIAQSDSADVVSEADRTGLALRERHAMPAKSLRLVFGLE